MDSSKRNTDHALNLSNRASLDLSGIEDVISFDEESVVMRSSLGMLTVDGSGLHVVKLGLDIGEVSIEGNISGIFYFDKQENGKKEKKLGRLFR